MLFNSAAFLVFFPLVTGLFFLLPHRFRWLLLLLASCYFYMYFRPVYILILFVTIVIDYYAGIFIHEAADKKLKKRYLLLSIVANVGILAVFKYYNFFNANLTTLLQGVGSSNPLPYLNILLPIGLSFHTFQAMSYTIEVYRGNLTPERHFGIYALYVMFYPQLVAGPIERPQNVLHQFHDEKQFDYSRVVSGLRLMLWGFFKKMVIADNISVYSDNVFNNPGQQNSATFLIGAFCFTIQIYCDFSGYSDIALGSARVMGFKLMRNFNVPYISTSVKEFWTRWHISLSTWFRDYVYIPMGGNRVGNARKYFNVFAVFLLSGFWHGASWNFVVWGGLHGLFVLLSEISGSSSKSTPQGVSLLTPIKMVLTFVLVMVFWIFFRVTDVGLAFSIVKSLFTGWLDVVADQKSGVAVFSGIQIADKLVFQALMLLVVVFLVLDGLKERSGVRSAFYKSPVLRYAVYFGLLLMILLFAYVKETAFIYFQF